jgi:hypothetical protein
MEQYFAYENMISSNNKLIEICMNDVVLENKSKENPNVQIETSNNPKTYSEKIMKGNLKKLLVQRKSWKPHGRTSLCWSFYFVNDNAKVD